MVFLTQALHALAEQLCEPTWDRERGEFSYRFGLGEPYPRGQANAVISRHARVRERQQQQGERRCMLFRYRGSASHPMWWNV